MSEVGGRRLRARPNAISWRPRRLEKMIDRARYRSWFAGKEFTQDWTSNNFTMWRRVLSPLRDEPLRILEIGSWEGRSALFFLQFFSRSTIVCIDTFAGTPQEHAIYAPMAEEIPGVERRFDRNLAAFAGRVEKIKSHSRVALERLAQQGRRFDLAYIDGSHQQDEVMADSVGAWQLVPPGGVVIWDDYRWRRDLPTEHRPWLAIDEFLRQREGHYRVLAVTYQIAVERLD
jgi:hypothetical protein